MASLLFSCTVIVKRSTDSTSGSSIIGASIPTAAATMPGMAFSSVGVWSEQLMSVNVITTFSASANSVAVCCIFFGPAGDRVCVACGMVWVVHNVSVGYGVWICRRDVHCVMVAGDVCAC